MQTQLEGQPHLVVCEFWYWVTRLQARFLAGDQPAALDASIRAKALVAQFLSRDLSCACDSFQVESDFYGALAHAAACDSPPAMKGGSTWTSWRAIFGSSSSGLGIARRTSRTEPLWSPRSWRGSKGGTAMPRGSTSTPSVRRARTDSSTTKPLPWSSPRISTRPVASTGLRGRTCETRGTATGSGVPTEKSGNSRRSIRIWQTNRFARTRNGTLVTPVEHLDLSTVLKLSQAVQGETELERLIAAIMRLSLEHAGAERGLLILPHGDAYSDRSRSQERE